MKVNETVGNVIIPKKTPQPEALVGGASGAGGPGGTGGPIKSSTFVMNKIKEAIRSEPEIRTELVEKYKALIKSGEYKTDPAKVAAKMISDSLAEDLVWLMKSKANNFA